MEKNTYLKKCNKFSINFFIFLAGALGFEPRMVVPKTTALPLGYAPILCFIYHKKFNLNSFCNNAPIFRVFSFKLFIAILAVFFDLKTP